MLHLNFSSKHVPQVWKFKNDSTEMLYEKQYHKKTTDIVSLQDHWFRETLQSIALP